MEVKAFWVSGLSIRQALNTPPKRSNASDGTFLSILFYSKTVRSIDTCTTGRLPGQFTVKYEVGNKRDVKGNRHRGMLKAAIQAFLADS